VSLLWRDEVGVHLSPRTVCMVRVKRGIKASFAGEHEQSVESQPAGDWRLRSQRPMRSSRRTIGKAPCCVSCSPTAG